MIFRQYFDLVSSTYTYLIADDRSREALLIDPVIERMPDYRQLLSELDLTLRIAADTHTHADHITALGELRDLTGCTTVMGEQSQATCVNRLVSSGDQLAVGELSIEALHTPGHTDDSVCFYLPVAGQPGCLFTGDTLLIRGTGRTDFQNGSAEEQYVSLFDKLLAYPDETLVYPGHDYKGWTVSTIGEEKQFNPRLQVSKVEDYVAIMQALNLPDPSLMDIAVPANQACGKPQW